MSKIAEHIDSLNKRGRKALTIFLTAGYPNKNSFLDNAKAVIDSGADILEIGVPFGDSLADGPVIQSSYYKALEENTSIRDVLKFVEAIKSERDIPIVIMGSSNPLNNYGTSKFMIDAENSGADGVIVPDVTLEEFDSFFIDSDKSIDKILLTTPTSSKERIKTIDEKSSGFVYCVSIVGTTGVHGKFDDTVIKNLERTYSIVKKNKLQIGFGISNGEDVKRLKDYCDGVIVGSAVIKLLNDKNGIKLSANLISDLSEACSKK
jgi:tryptophan synthase alpha chain